MTDNDPPQQAQEPQQAQQEDKESEQEENPATSNHLQNFLSERGIPYTVTRHAACRTSEESAAVRGVSLDAGAKAILLKDTSSKTNGHYMLAVMSASQRFSSKQFKTISNCKKIRFATPDEVWQVTQCVPGAIPPFGSLFGIVTWVDRSLSRQETIHFNCGLRTASIAMTYADYVVAEQPRCQVFTEEEMALGEISLPS